MSEPANENDEERGRRLRAIKAIVSKEYPAGLDQALIDRYRIKAYEKLCREWKLA